MSSSLENEATSIECDAKAPNDDRENSPAQKELTKILVHMKEDAMGISGLGEDGVLRSWDADRNVVDATPLRPDLIKAYLDRLPYDEVTEKAFRGVDGRNVPREDWFHPPKALIPEPLPEEHRERDEKVLEKYRKQTEEWQKKMISENYEGWPVVIRSDNKIY